MRTPAVRILDASLVDHDAHVRLALAGLDAPERLRDELAAQPAVDLQDDRLTVTTTLGALAAAAARTGGDACAAAITGAVDRALAAWRGPAPDLPATPLPLRTSQGPVVMGVLNVTPDSFSDGGRHLDAAIGPTLAIEAGLELIEQGADIVDVGGESTRPGAEPVAVDVELARVVPVIAALADAGATVSVDTSKSAVARAAVEAGASIVNDVSAGAFDPDLLPTVAELSVSYVLMHLKGTPRTMQAAPHYLDVAAEVFGFLSDRLATLAAIGIDTDRVVVDPGIGFGKTLAHNVTLLRRLREFTSLGRPVLVGASRKSFIGALTGADDPTDRVEGSLAAATLAVAGGASILRVHDVAATVRAVAVARAVADAD